MQKILKLSHRLLKLRSEPVVSFESKCDEAEISYLTLSSSEWTKQGREENLSNRRL